MTARTCLVEEANSRIERIRISRRVVVMVEDVLCLRAQNESPPLKVQIGEAYSLFQGTIVGCGSRRQVAITTGCLI